MSRPVYDTRNMEERATIILDLLASSDMTVDELLAHLPKTNRSALGAYLRKMRRYNLVHVHKYIACAKGTIAYAGLWRIGPGNSAVYPRRARKRAVIPKPIPSPAPTTAFQYGTASMTEKYLYLCGLCVEPGDLK